MNEVAQRGATGGAAGIGPGAVLAARFRLDRPLGSGGMAEVWRALDLATQRPIALKLLRPQIAASPEAVQRLKREGEVLSALSHPAIVRVETYGQLDNGTVYVAMELLEGETLGARMRRGPMQPFELAPVVTGTCAALAAAHAKNIVHRDLKPDNIFLVPLADGSGHDGPQVKLLDFGISKVFDGDRLTYTGEVLGTPRYMSPEQLGAEPDVDARVDIYSLGVILYEALAGRPPFLAATPTDLIVAILHGKAAPLRSLRPDVPAALEAVIMRAMARAREARYRSATELADAFLDAAGATASVRALPKKVLRTQALGGADQSVEGMPLPMRSSAPELGTRRSIEPAEAFRPGTFSAFDAIDESQVHAAATTVRSPMPADVVETVALRRQRPEGPAAVGAPPPPMAAGLAETAPLPRQSYPGHPTPVPLASAGRADPSGAHSHSFPPATASSTSWVPPFAQPPAEPAAGSSLGRRVALIAAGLLAGAVSAAIAVGALYYARRDAGGEAPAQAAGAPTALAAPGAEAAPEVAEARGAVGGAPGAEAMGGGLAGSEPGDGPPADPATEAQLTASDSASAAETGGAALGETPDEADSDARAEGASGAGEPDARGGSGRRGRRSRAREIAPEPGPIAIAAPGVTTITPPPLGSNSLRPASPLEEAGRALAAGDAPRCIRLLDELLARGGPAFALKLRGDCELRAGRRADAVRDYQQFCRTAPQHPAITGVREQLAGMGYTCP